MDKPVVIHKKDGPVHTVLIPDIKVLVSNNDGSWFAQGLEIDYAAQGQSLQDVKNKFSEGLERTLDAHLATYKNIKGVLQLAPKEYWDQYFGQVEQWVYTHGSVHVATADITVTLKYVEPRAELAGAA